MSGPEDFDFFFFLPFCYIVDVHTPSPLYGEGMGYHRLGGLEPSDWTLLLLLILIVFSLISIKYYG